MAYRAAVQDDDDDDDESSPLPSEPSPPAISSRERDWNPIVKAVGAGLQSDSGYRLFLFLGERPRAGIAFFGGVVVNDRRAAACLVGGKARASNWRSKVGIIGVRNPCYFCATDNAQFLVISPPLLLAPMHASSLKRGYIHASLEAENRN